MVRGDGWSRLWVQLVTIALPLQPLVWVARMAFYTACEEACDDWSVASGSDPVDLATTLLAWSNCPTSPDLLAGIGMSSTKARIQRLLALHAKPVARLGRGWRWTSIPAAIVSIAGLAVAQTPQQVKQPSQKAAASTQSGTSEQPPGKRLDKNSKELPDTMTISGTCVDENKKPLVNARVRLFLIDFYPATSQRQFEDMSQRQIAAVPVDGDGRFRIPDVETRSARPGYASLVLVAQSPGKATAVSGWLDQEKALGQTFDFTLGPAATMQGRISDAKGRPIANATVSAGTGAVLMEPVPGIGAAVTDAAGHYEISDLRPYSHAKQKPQPAGNGLFTIYGKPRAQVRHPDYARQPFYYTKVPSVANATMHRVAEVEGQIVLGDDGQPVIEALLEFYNDLVAMDYWTRITTDDHGRYKLATLPPGEYRLSVKRKGLPNLFRLSVPLPSGKNTLDLRMEKGGKIKGHFIDVNTGKPPALGKDEQMQVSTFEPNGVSYAGMNYADMQSDGSFTLLVPAGRNHLGVYLGPKWRGINTDALVEKAIIVADGQTLELDIRVEPRTQKPM